MKKNKIWLICLAVFTLLIGGYFAYRSFSSPTSPIDNPSQNEIIESGQYWTKDDVANYIYQFHHLPSNYLTKKQAQEKGWEGGALHQVIQNHCIGGDKFSNNEGLLPILDGREYYSADINVVGDEITTRGSERIVYSNDGLIYYTPDNYQTFTLLFGEPTSNPTDQPTNPSNGEVVEDGTYWTKDEVALYIHTYGKLPSNYMTKREAKKQGWSSGSLDKVVPGYSIGGDRFGNNEGNLPKKNGRTYTECDIDTVGQKSRGSKRIVFSNDGLIYYTEDHYEHFELLYGEE